MHTIEFPFKVTDHEAEKASNSYLMSLIAVIAGLPLPILNLLATVVFYFANRRATYFVRWHCTQALLSQLSLFFINSFGFWWTVSIIFFDENISSNYIAYMIIVLITNFIEFVATIYTAVITRRGEHVSWWFYGSLTDIICKK